MGNLQEQVDLHFGPGMNDGTILVFMRRMATVRHGQDRLLTALQSLSGGDAVVLMAAASRTKAPSLR